MNSRIRPLRLRAACLAALSLVAAGTVVSTASTSPLGDVNGDGKKDLVTFVRAAPLEYLGDVFVAFSTDTITTNLFGSA